MKLTANITLDELTKSQVAERKGINNNPNPQQIENLKNLAINILQPVRSHFDKPLIFNNGFPGNLDADNLDGITTNVFIDFYYS